MVRERVKLAKSVVNRSLVTYLSPHNVIAEQFRTIHNNIHFASNGNELRSIMFTSPSDGEGKSTAAINLAVSMAQRGDHVLLIDANLRSSMLHQIFGIGTVSGLSNVLAQQIDIEEAIQVTEIERLELLPSGQRQINSTELLHSKMMTSIMEYAHSHYDRIILDCPSVLGIPDTSALVSKCDGVVLLLQSGKTTHKEALEAKQALSFAGANIIGAILNKKSVR